MTDDEKIGAIAYCDLRISALERRLDERLDVLQRELDHMNGGSLLPRNEYNIAHDKMAEDIKVLCTFKDTQTGKASQNSVIAAWAIGLLGVAVGIVGIFVKGG